MTMFKPTESTSPARDNWWLVTAQSPGGGYTLKRVRGIPGGYTCQKGTVQQPPVLPSLQAGMRVGKTLVKATPEFHLSILNHEPSSSLECPFVVVEKANFMVL